MDLLSLGGRSSGAFHINDDGVAQLSALKGLVLLSGPTVPIENAATLFNPKTFSESPSRSGKNDQTWDDGPAIQRAIAAAYSSVASPPFGRNEVRIPAGDYWISKSLIMDGSYITLSGSGQYATTIHLMPLSRTPDQSAVISVGPSGTVAGVLIRDLSVEAGSDQGHVAGVGIIFDSGDSYLSRVYVAHTPGDSVRFVPTTSSTQNGAEWVYINLPGNDAFVIGANNHDTDWFRVLIKGGSSIVSKGGRYGIYNQGAETHLIACHPFFMATDGLRSDSGNVQVIGGEYETNTGIGINLISQTNDCSISGITGFYGNGINDISVGSISTGNHVSISACTFKSSVVRNVIVSTSAQGTISGCTFKNFTSEGLLLNTGADSWNVTSNVFDAASASTRCLVVVSTHNTIVSNQFLSFHAIESGAANFNVFSANSLNGTGIPTILGANSIQVNNV